MKTDIPMPYENCTQEEAVDFLRKHIEARDEEIARLKALYDDANEAAQKRAWAMDRAVRMYERNPGKPADLHEVAEAIREYIEIVKPDAKLLETKIEVA